MSLLICSLIQLKVYDMYSSSTTSPKKTLWKKYSFSLWSPKHMSFKLLESFMGAQEAIPPSHCGAMVTMVSVPLLQDHIKLGEPSTEDGWSCFILLKCKVDFTLRRSVIRDQICRWCSGGYYINQSAMVTRAVTYQLY